MDWNTEWDTGNQTQERSFKETKGRDSASYLKWVIWYNGVMDLTSNFLKTNAKKKKEAIKLRSSQFLLKGHINSHSTKINHVINDRTRIWMYLLSELVLLLPLHTPSSSHSWGERMHSCWSQFIQPGEQGCLPE